MKFLLLISLIFAATQVQAKKVKSDFGAELLKGVQEDVKKDDSVFKKPAASRAPASIPTAVEPERPLDKKTNQLGKPAW